ncbi:MAG: hemerythrin domain-containing protein [Myxococcales bacterium]|nr:hemerythrin domain-containing protein [Myxococcales bacterium]
MNEFSSFFTAEHRLCDAIWADLEGLDQKDQGRARELWESFAARMRRHFAMEEEVLFPAFEDATGMHEMGPTAVMRAEHSQMRALLDRMARDAAAGNVKAVLDQGDTLLMVIQQHNTKEEGILYPMADRALKERWTELQERLRSYS